MILLDEPTNDLDVETLRALESALLDFPGCAVVISHDRWFLDRTATHILAFEGNSEVVWFTGNYDDYERDRKRSLGEDDDQPQEIKYKTLIRDLSKSFRPKYLFAVFSLKSFSRADMEPSLRLTTELNCERLV